MHNRFALICTAELRRKFPLARATSPKTTRQTAHQASPREQRTHRQHSVTQFVFSTPETGVSAVFSTPKTPAATPAGRTSLQHTAIAPFAVVPRATFSTTFSTHTSPSASVIRFHVVPASLSCWCSPSWETCSPTPSATCSKSLPEKPWAAPSLEVVSLLLSPLAFGREKSKGADASCLFGAVDARAPDIKGSLSATVTLAREHCG